MTSRIPLKTLVVLAFLVGLLALVGCGSDDGDDSTGGQSDSTIAEEATAEDQAAEDETTEEPPPPEQPSPADLEAAGIDLATGVTGDAAPDTRTGTPSPPARSRPLPAAAGAAGCDLRLNLRDEGNDHLIEGDPLPRYRTNPPTSGPHDPVPLADGAYETPVPETGIVHSLEHGRVAIQYDPSLPRRTQLLLKGLFEEDADGMVLVPNPDMPFAVAATAWRNLMGCRTAGSWPELKTALVAFRDRYRGRGPERIPL